MDIRKVAVAGTGMMGPRIAAAIALSGREVTIVSRKMETARSGVDTARQQISWLSDNSLVSAKEAAEATDRLSASDDPIDTVASVDCFIESIPEDLEIKRDYFAALDAASPGAILCSNTSGISISRIADSCTKPERVFTTHFWNPPHLMPLVEVVLGEKSDPSLGDTVVEFLKSCGKTPVLVRKDTPGQLGNRIQHAMVRECVNIVAEGIASAEDVDLAVKAGFGLRTPVYGVFEHGDMVGLDLHKAVQDIVNPALCNAKGALPIHNAKVEAGDLGVKTGRGFLDWPEGKADEVRSRRDEFILEFLRMQKSGRFV